jgi:hypothetical protein
MANQTAQDEMMSLAKQLIPYLTYQDEYYDSHDSKWYICKAEENSLVGPLNESQLTDISIALHNHLQVQRVWPTISTNIEKCIGRCAYKEPTMLMLRRYRRDTNCWGLMEFSMPKFEKF